MKNSIEKWIAHWLTLGLLLEIVVVLLAYWESNGTVASFFQSAARLSGRVSLLFFSILMIYATLVPGIERGATSYRVKYILFRDFAVVHLIHLCILTVSVYLNHFELLPIRLAGGVIAYGLVVLMPYLMQKSNTKQPLLIAVQATYMFWVWLVFSMTYTARLSGSTPVHSGSPASWWPFFIWLIALIFWRSVILLRQSWVTKK